LELDLEHYVVPAPSSSPNSSAVYAADMTENPRSRNSGYGSNSYSAGDDSGYGDQPETVNILLSHSYLKFMIDF
jgi:6-phosphofructo-2-kinase / fructose-2,6-biphosphatase 3